MIRAACLTAMLWASNPLLADDALSAVESLVELRYPVTAVEAEELDRQLATDQDALLLFDVREPEEFAVSHLPGGIRLDPEISSAEFIELYGPQVAGRRVVFYCSVGMRSSRLAEALTPALEKLGAQSVANLRGGIFRWQGEGGPLQNAAGPTRYVHPYDRRWGQLIPNDGPRRLTPEPRPAQSNPPPAAAD